MGQAIAEIVEQIVDLAQREPDRAAELGPALARGLAWNVAPASTLLASLSHRWVTPLDIRRVAWLDDVTNAEQRGLTRQQAIREAGEVPR